MHDKKFNVREDVVDDGKEGEGEGAAKRWRSTRRVVRWWVGASSTGDRNGGTGPGGGRGRGDESARGS